MKISLLDVQKFLADHLRTDVTNVQSVGLGEWSQAFFFTTAGRDKVIRFSRIDEDFRKDQYAAQFSSAQLPIPAIEEIGQAFDGYFAISPKVEGKMIDHLEAEEMQQALPALLGVIKSLRSVDTSQSHGFGGYGLNGNGTSGSWKEFLTGVTVDSPSSRTSGWKEKLAGNKEAYKIFEQAYQQFFDLVDACPEERHLVHNDLLHYNLIMKDNVVAAVIDWGCALYGDSLYDLAMFTTWQFYYPAMQGIDFVVAAKQYFNENEIELPHLEQRLQCYQIHLLLDSLAYNSYKENQENLAMVVKRLKEIL
jgi:hygromycin-B 4-O-kinase